MDVFQGTKGNWFIDKEESGTNEHGASFLAISSQVGTAKAKGICDVYSSIANAKLIACAPEMLEALIHIEDFVTRSLTLSGHSEKDIEIILRKVRPAIKKATT